MKLSDYYKLKKFVNFYSENYLKYNPKGNLTKKIIFKTLLYEIKKIEKYNINLQSKEHINFFKTDENNKFKSATDYIINRFLNNCRYISFDYENNKKYLYDVEQESITTIACYVLELRNICFQEELDKKEFISTLTHELLHSLEYNKRDYYFLPDIEKEYEQVTLNLKNLNRKKYSNQINNLRTIMKQINDVKVNNVYNVFPTQMNEGITELYTAKILNKKFSKTFNMRNGEIYKKNYEGTSSYYYNTSYMNMFIDIISERNYYNARYQVKNNLDARINSIVDFQFMQKLVNEIKIELNEFENKNNMSTMIKIKKERNIANDYEPFLSNKIAYCNLFEIIEIMLSNIDILHKILYCYDDYRDYNFNHIYNLLENYLIILDAIFSILFIIEKRNKITYYNYSVQKVEKEILDFKTKIIQHKNPNIVKYPSDYLIKDFQTEIKKIKKEKTYKLINN